MGWTPTGTGHELTIQDGRIVARNAKGRILVNVPAKVKKTEAYEQLDDLLIFLADHDAEVGEQVERWLLRSLPVPTTLLAQVWADETWRSWLTDLVIATDDEDDEVVGFLRAADATGLGVIDLDGESQRLNPAAIVLPPPVLLADLDELREFAAELGIEQRFDQLFREVHRKPDPLPKPEASELDTWSGGHFDQLRFAVGRAQGAGFRVLGGYAATTIHEGDQEVTARYWIGADYPDEPTETGLLHWVQANEVLSLKQVGPVAYSEGVRMANRIYAGRKVEKEER